MRYSLWYNALTMLPATGRQQTIINGIINKPLLLHPVGRLYYCIYINDARSSKYQIMKYIY